MFPSHIAELAIPSAIPRDVYICFLAHISLGMFLILPIMLSVEQYSILPQSCSVSYLISPVI